MPNTHGHIYVQDTEILVDIWLKSPFYLAELQKGVVYMRTDTKLKELTLAAMLTGIAVVIPMLFPKFVIFPPFTATLAAHVPIMIAMCISRKTVAIVGFGSTIGFYFAFPGLPVVWARVSTHMIFAFVGNYMLRKRHNVYFVITITAILHAVFEMMLVLVPLFYPTQIGLEVAMSLLAFGTLIHHIVDAIITAPIVSLLKKLNLVPVYDFTLKRKHLKN